eukprot:m.526691 g.526691  ORF g.526691 m.526691 type:complete len:198 (+) comp57552_c0_seq11:309-902(+)
MLPTQTVPHLHGVTMFGDNIDDEWFIVFLLYAITREFPELTATVSDSAGQLLIEAADFLPEWLDPDIAENRVFIRQGKLHIIPVPTSPGTISIFPFGIPDLSHSLSLLRSPHNTLASVEIQAQIDQRIAEFPGKAQTLMHHTKCFVPSRLAQTLQLAPHLISRAVIAYYERDAIDMKEFDFWCPAHRSMLCCAALCC